MKSKIPYVTLTYKSVINEICKVKLHNPVKKKLLNNKFVWKGQQKVRGALVDRSIHSDDLIN